MRKNQTNNTFLKVILILAIVFVGAYYFMKSKIKKVYSEVRYKEDIFFLKDFELRGHDHFGSGAYGAPRGTRTHNGADIVFRAGSEVRTPFECKVTREGQVYGDDTKYKLIELIGTKGYFKGYKMKIMYCKSTTNINPDLILQQHTPIGVCQDIASKYNTDTKKMKNHLHIEMWDSNNKRINPEKFH